MKKKGISEYFENETQALLTRYKNLEKLIPKVKTNKKSGKIAAGSYHPAEEGRFLEEILKSLLNEHLPKGIRAITGFILRPATQVGLDDNRRQRDQIEDLHSPQIDIIVYDTINYPIFESFGDFAIVPPEGVLGIISVKKNLYLNQIVSELKALKYSAALCWHYNYNKDLKNGYNGNEIVKGPVTAIIAFSSKEKESSLAKNISYFIKTTHDIHSSADGIIKQISIIEKFTIFRGKERLKKNQYRIPFIKFDHKKRINFPIQILLRSLFEVYYDRTRSPVKIRPGYIDFDEKTLLNKNFDQKIYCKKNKLDFEYMINNKDYLK